MTQERIIICGSRTFNDRDFLFRKMDRLCVRFTDIVVLSGAARGADAYGEEWAFYWWWTVMRYHPDYKLHGNMAPFVRNQEMVENADRLVAFWNGRSGGTKDVIRKARKWGVKVKVYTNGDW
jgi:hypothetical protein